MNRRTFAFSLTGAAALVKQPKARAESAKEGGSRLVEKVIQGLGGDAFRRMQTRTETGRAYSFYREQLSGLSVARIYTKYLEPHAEADGKPAILQLQRQVLGKKEEEAVIFVPGEAYDVTYRGAQPLGNDQVNRYRETTLNDILYILRARTNEPGIEFESGPRDVVENQSVEVLDVYDSENRRITVWLNSGTLLPIKQRFYRWDPIISDRREEVTHYTKYWDIGGGVMWPLAIERQRDGEKVFVMYSDHASANDPLADTMFELPNGIRMLKK